MIEKFADFEKFKEAAKEHNISSDLDSLRSLDIVFYEDYDEDYMILSLPPVGEAFPNQILILSKDFNLAYCPETKKKYQKLKLSKVKNKSYVSSTLLLYEVVSSALDVYFTELSAVKKELNRLHDIPDIDEVEHLAKRNRKIRDIAEDVLRLSIELEEEEFKYVNTDVIPYEFDIMLARSRHLVDRFRGTRREIDVLRTKCDIAETRKLNKRIEFLTNVVVVLTLITIVISIPNTVATIYGIPVIGGSANLDVIYWALAFSTIVAIFLSYIYMRRVL